MSQRDPASPSSSGADGAETSGKQGRPGTQAKPGAAGGPWQASDRPSAASPQPRAGHGYRNEVSWRGGQGRQPYTNQDPDAPPSPAALPEAEQGDRGAHSGVHQQQMRDVRGKP